MSESTGIAFAVLLHILVPGEQEVIKQIGPDYDTAAACNASYLAMEFDRAKPDTHRYECIGVDANGNYVRPNNSGAVVLRPPKLFRDPDTVIQIR